MTAKQWGDIAYVVTALGLILLSVGFLTLTTWWETAVGRSLAAFFGAVFLIMLFSSLLLLGILSPKSWWLYDLRVGLYGSLGLAVWAMLIGFVKVQFFPGKKKRVQDDRNHTRQDPGGSSRSGTVESHR